MASIFLLLAYPALVFGNIEVELIGELGNEHDMKVFYSGSDVDIISDTERQTFGLSDNRLKDAVASFFGRRPDDVYLRSPTPWGDLYQSYDWNQVERTLLPINGKVLGFSSEPSVIQQQIFENNSSKTGTFNVGISQKVKNTLTSTWSKGGAFTVGQEINYGCKIGIVSGGGKTSFSYTSSWGENIQKSETVTMGSSQGVSVPLEPGQSVFVQLQATRSHLKVEMEYEASLSGTVAVNYKKPYKGHHFWGLDLKSVMANAGLSNQKISKEVIEIGFYSQSKIIVQDKNSNMKIIEVDF